MLVALINPHALFLCPYGVCCVMLLRLNNCDSDGEGLYIQMVSALVLQLIQCVVRLPFEKETEDEQKKKVATEDKYLFVFSASESSSLIRFFLFCFTFS